MIKTFSDENECLAWLKSQSGLRFYAKTKAGNWVGVAIDLKGGQNGTK